MTKWGWSQEHWRLNNEELAHVHRYTNRLRKKNPTIISTEEKALNKTSVHNLYKTQQTTICICLPALPPARTKSSVVLNLLFHSLQTNVQTGQNKPAGLLETESLCVARTR